MAQGKLKQYRGPLDPEQIAQGMNAASRNAARLAQDARLLLNSRRFPSAVSLAVLSIEEHGKVSILRLVAMARDDRVRRGAWRDYRSHRSKNTSWILPQLVAEGARTLDELRPATDAGADHAVLLDQVKQVATYTDCLGDARWSEPEEVVDEALARSLVATAELFAKAREVSAREIELWIELVGPTYGQPLDLMKAALHRWYVAAREEGSEIPGDDVVPVDAFIWGGAQERE